MTSTSGQPSPVVTLAALYGAAGGVIGPQVAERLGVPFLDRAIPEGAARRSGLQDQAVVDVEEQRRTGLQRLNAGLGRLSTITGGAGGTDERLDAEEHDARSRIEGFLAEASRSGGVALGRGGMVILRSVPWALHVHLGGPPASRIAQQMALEGIDQDTATARLHAEDRARHSYVRRAYGVDPGDSAFYHLMIDSTALDLDTCVELIVTAATARTRAPRPSPSI